MQKMSENLQFVFILEEKVVGQNFDEKEFQLASIESIVDTKEGEIGVRLTQPLST